MNTSGYLKSLTMFVLILALAGGCSDSPTEPDKKGNGTGDLGILSSLISVAVIPGGSETIIITAITEDGSPDTYSASIDDEAIATITQIDSAVEVTGVDFGQATLTITSGSGSTKGIPVQVYDHRVLDCGELQISFVDTYEYVARASGHENYAQFYHPVVPEGYHALGSLGFPGQGDADGKYAMMVVKQDDGSDALAAPIGYERIEYVMYCIPPVCFDSLNFWYPIPPEGYYSLGTVVKQGQERPSLSDVVCVREDLTTAGSLGSRFIYDHVDYRGEYYSCWEIEPPETGPHEMAYLHTGTFTASRSWHMMYPEDTKYRMVLKVDLPMLAEAPTQAYIPQMESYDSPPEVTVPLMSKVMLVPCTIVNDLNYTDQISWRVANSPFYRLERQVFYKLLYHNYNQTSETQTNEYTIRSGVTTEQSDKFYNETSISVTAEVGLNIDCFSGKVSTTVSRKLGYEQLRSIKELEQTYISSSINTAPGKAAALWQKHTRLVLMRHNGTTLELVGEPLEFGIESYVTDEYPNE